MEISIKWNVCRTCLLEEVNLGPMKPLNDDAKIRKQIFECAGIEIEPNDGLPEKICQKCLISLRNAAKFRSTCHNSQEYLQSVMRKTKSATALFKLDKRLEIAQEMVDDEFEEIQENEQIETQSFTNENTNIENVKEQEEEQDDDIKNSIVDIETYEEVLGQDSTIPQIVPSKCEDEEIFHINMPESYEDIELNTRQKYLEILWQHKARYDKKLKKRASIVKTESGRRSNSCDNESIVEKNAEQKENNPNDDMEDDYSENGSQLTTKPQFYYFLKDKNDGNDDVDVELMQTENQAVRSIELKKHKHKSDEEFSNNHIIDNDMENDGDDEANSPKMEAIEFLDTQTVGSDSELKCMGSEHILMITDTSSTITPNKRRTRKKSSSVQFFVCEICANNFNSRSMLNYHMRIHRNEKNFECEICFKRFNAACNLVAHLRIHTGEKPYECKFCGRRFTDRSTHIKHERIHTNEKPFTCNICTKSFSLSTSLRAHERIHTGEKPFKCPPCAKAFKLSHQLKAHCSTNLHKLLALHEPVKC